MQCTSNTCKHFERFNFCSQASTVAWRGWRIAHLALPYLFTFTASPESHRLMYGSVPDCQWNQWPVSNISLSEMASARASAQLWWWWWWVISLVSPLVSSLVGGAVYANVIWPGMKWKYAPRTSGLPENRNQPPYNNTNNWSYKVITRTTNAH